MIRSRREIVGALAASGAVLASAPAVRANPVDLDLTTLKKEADVACLVAELQGKGFAYLKVG